MLSSTDILRVSYQYGTDDRQTDAMLDHTVTVSELMKEPTCVKRTETVRDAVRVLAEGTFHSLPVTTDSGELVGIVTTTDVMRYLLDQLS